MSSKGLSRAVIEVLEARGISSARVSEIATLVADLEAKGVNPTKIFPIGIVNPEVEVSMILNEAALQNLFHAVSATSANFAELRILTHGIPPVVRQYVATFVT